MLAVRYPRGSAALHDLRSAAERGVLVRGVRVACGFGIASPPGFHEVTVAVPGLGSHGPYPPGVDTRSLVREDVTAVGHQLYAMVRPLAGYEAAIVGYDPEERIDLDLLREERDEWPEPPEGLVLADALVADLGWGESVEPFAPGYRWSPYPGDAGGRER
jgi:hypothetical protein